MHISRLGFISLSDPIILKDTNMLSLIFPPKLCVPHLSFFEESKTAPDSSTGTVTSVRV